MEFWVFEVVTVIVAHMGSVVVGTNQILLTITRYSCYSLVLFTTAHLFAFSPQFLLSVVAVCAVDRGHRADKSAACQKAVQEGAYHGLAVYTRRLRFNGPGCRADVDAARLFRYVLKVFVLVTHTHNTLRTSADLLHRLFVSRVYFHEQRRHHKPVAHPGAVQRGLPGCVRRVRLGAGCAARHLASVGPAGVSICTSLSLPLFSFRILIISRILSYASDGPSSRFGWWVCLWAATWPS